MSFKLISLVPLLLNGVNAFPWVMDPSLSARQEVAGCSTNAACNARMEVSDEQIAYDPKNPTAAQKTSAARKNDGFLCPITTFDAKEQLVSVSGENAWAAPGPSDIRGPCPGLNAAANHGYLPRNGVATIPQTIAGLGDLYGMGPALAGFLAAYAVAIDGDILSLSWSIGGPASGSTILGPGVGISWSHNKYEGDTSISRCDAYVNGGDGHSLSPVRFSYAFESGMANDRYTFDTFSQAFAKNAIRSEAQNPNYFAPLFSTTLVSPAAYNFVIAMMSNHTAEEPTGYLNGDIFKSFFSVTGEYPDFKWVPGHERVPENWYRRPTSQPYSIARGVFGDLLPEFLAYPNSFRFGGNTNGVNTYAGIDLEDLTGGAYNTSMLFEGNNLACFFYQTVQQGLPDFLTTGIVGEGLSLLTGYLNQDTDFASLGCPQVAKFNDNNLPPYPGRTYSPTGPANTC